MAVLAVGCVEKGMFDNIHIRPTTTLPVGSIEASDSSLFELAGIQDKMQVGSDGVLTFVDSSELTLSSAEVGVAPIELPDQRFEFNKDLTSYVGRAGWIDLPEGEFFESFVLEGMDDGAMVDTVIFRSGLFRVEADGLENLAGYDRSELKIVVPNLLKDNRVERLFWAKLPLGRATSYFYYRKGSSYCNIVHRLKYEGNKKIGRVMGRCMAAELLPSGFFEGVDVLMPVPLHPKKQRARGYNQSELLARGLSEVTGLPVDARSLVRQKHVESQTRKSAYERWANVEGIFRLECPERFAGKHVLLVDDVLTTGATTTACADAFAGVPDVRISILTLSMAD